jgi:hypothetical protein
MTHFRGVGCAAIVLALLLAAAPAPAVPAPEPEVVSALALVPAESPLVIQLRGLERTKGRLLAMLQNALPDLTPMIKTKLDDAFKEGLEGRQLKGLAADGPVLLAFQRFPKAGEEDPPVVGIARVTNYREFVTGLLTAEERKTLKADPAGFETATLNNSTVYFLNRKAYAIITLQKETAIQLTKAVRGLDQKLTKEDIQRFLSADLSAYVDITAVNKEYGEQIKNFRQLMEVLLGQGDGAPGTLDKNTLQLVKAIYGAAFQVLEDSRAFLLLAEFRPEGLSLRSQLQVGPATKSGTFLKGAKPGVLRDIGTLPSRQLGYWAMQLDPELARTMQPWMLGLVFGDDPPKAVKEALAKLAEAGPRTWLASASTPLLGLQVIEYKDPVKAAAAQLELLRALEPGQQFQSGILKGRPEIKADAQEHKGFKLHAVRLTWDHDKLAEQAGSKEMAQAMKQLLGDGLDLWIGTNGKVYVQIMGKDWADARKQLDQYIEGKATVGHEEAYAEARKQLAAEATLLSLLDMPRYLQAISEFMQPLLQGAGLPFNFPVLKADKAKTTFVGMTVTLQPERGSVELWVPATAVVEVRKMIEPLLKALRGADGE